MQGDINNQISILEELNEGNAELGESFALALKDMIRSDGDPNPYAQSFDIMPESWRRIANKKDRTEEELKNLNKDFNNTVKILAQSYLLYIAREIKNKTGKLNYSEFETFMFKNRFRQQQSIGTKKQIQNAFNKIDNRGGKTGGDGLIDKNDMARFIYAISLQVRGGVDDELNFDIPGFVEPIEFAVDDRFLFDENENLLSLKLKVANNMLSKEE